VNIDSQKIFYLPYNGYDIIIIEIGKYFFPEMVIKNIFIEEMSLTFKKFTVLKYFNEERQSFGARRVFESVFKE
jgi:hypothetical protein